MSYGNRRAIWGWGLLTAVGMIMGNISNCAWAMDGTEQPFATPASSPSITSSAITCPQYGEIAAQVTFYPNAKTHAVNVNPKADNADTPGITINLEVADSPAQKRCGLMFRDRLPNNRGMGFPFTPPRPVSFWMKNVPVALDMVFVQRDFNGDHNDYHVLDIITAPPCTNDPCPTYGPKGVVSWVIELGAERATEMGLKKGDRLTIQRSPSASHNDDSVQ